MITIRHEQKVEAGVPLFVAYLPPPQMHLLEEGLRGRRVQVAAMFGWGDRHPEGLPRAWEASCLAQARAIIMCKDAMPDATSMEAMGSVREPMWSIVIRWGDREP